jgi:chaperonin GroES
MTNKIIPTTFRVLVESQKIEEKTKGGIIIPEEKRRKDEIAGGFGVIKDLGEVAFENWDNKPKVGDTVMFKSYAGISVKMADYDNCRLLNDDEIIAIIN